MNTDFADFYTVSPISGGEESSTASLYENGRVAVPVQPDELPAWFVPVRIYGVEGFLSARNVISVSYRPSFISPGHLFRDDSLSIVYGSPNGEKAGTRLVIWGARIIPFIDRIRTFSPECDVSMAMKLLAEKLDSLSAIISSVEAPLQ